jgi:hypothetical protein
MPLLHGMGLAGRTSALVRSGARLADGLRHRVPAQSSGRFRELLAEADGQDPGAAREALLRAAVDHLVPDEARILDFLAHQPSGAAAPVIHIHSLTGTGLPGEPALVNASTVGHRAGVALPATTPRYVTRLLAADLVELGEEDPRLEDDYHALLADPGVLAAVSQVVRSGGTPRVLRHTLTISALGRALCGDVRRP